MNVELDYERNRLSKAARAVLGEVDEYFIYYEKAKKEKPPVIRLAAKDKITLGASLKRLKLDGKDLLYKGVEVL